MNTDVNYFSRSLFNDSDAEEPAMFVGDLEDLESDEEAEYGFP